MSSQGPSFSPRVSVAFGDGNTITLERSPVVEQVQLHNQDALGAPIFKRRIASASRDSPETSE